MLLDNYYCNGVKSSDGHQWATQGITSAYREKDWDCTRCTYDFGVDPLCYAGCGFIWDHLLRQGVSFRNFGEWTIRSRRGATPGSDFYRAWKNADGSTRFRCNYFLDSLARYSDLRFPGWESAFPTRSRADVFLTALGEFEKAGSMPEFVIIYLPNDHTHGSDKNVPTPRAVRGRQRPGPGPRRAGLVAKPLLRRHGRLHQRGRPQLGADYVEGIARSVSSLGLMSGAARW